MWWQRLAVGIDRLVCRLRGHQRVRVFDKVEVRDADQFGLGFRVLEQHHRCTRCGTDPL